MLKFLSHFGDSETAVNRWVLLCLILSVHCAMLTWSAARQAPTVDEPMHLASGIRILTTARYDVDRGNPPLWKVAAALPVVMAGVEVDWKSVPYSFNVGDDLLRANGARSFELVSLARLGLVPVSLWAGFIIFAWSSTIFGPRSGLVAVALWCFSPFVIANGEIATGDMTAASMTVTTCYACRNWLSGNASWKACFLLGTALGLAAIAKYACLILFILAPVAAIAIEIGRWRSSRARPVLRTTQLAVVLLLATDVINIAYLVQGTCAPLAEYNIGKKVVAKIFGSEDSGLMANAGSFALQLPVPLPYDYVKGVDEIDGVLERGHNLYFNGQWHTSRPWHYYIVGLLLKFPLGTVFILISATLYSCAHRFLRRSFDGYYLLFCILMVFVFIANVTSVKYLRYILPIVPLLCIWGSQLACVASIRSRLWNWCSTVGVITTIAAAFAIFPHSGSFFNLLAGGPNSGHKYYIESSFGWGQDLLYLKRWLDNHDEVECLSLAYMGRIDPRLAGISFRTPPKQLPLDDLRRKFDDGGPKPGWYAVSGSLVQGFPWAVPDGQGATEFFKRHELEYFQLFNPVAKAGYSIFIYHITVDEANRIRDALGLEPISIDARGGE